MKFFIFPLFFIFLLSCKKTKRDFFLNLKAENTFLDTFSLSNLKGFGLSTKSTVRNGKNYYDFNVSENSIHTNGSFRRIDEKLFFLPNGSDTELLFLDLRWNNSSVITPQSLKTKNRSFYNVEWLKKSYDETLRDSVYFVKLNNSDIFNRPEDLLFVVSKKFELISIEQINCKHDTLTIILFPKQKVYFKHISKSAVCL